MTRPLGTDDPHGDDLQLLGATRRVSERTAAEMSHVGEREGAILAFDLAERRGPAALADWARTYGRAICEALRDGDFGDERHTLP